MHVCEVLLRCFCGVSDFRKEGQELVSIYCRMMKVLATLFCASLSTFLMDAELNKII